MVIELTRQVKMSLASHSFIVPVHGAPHFGNDFVAVVFGSVEVCPTIISAFDA